MLGPPLRTPRRVSLTRPISRVGVEVGRVLRAAEKSDVSSPPARRPALADGRPALRSSSAVGVHYLGRRPTLASREESDLVGQCPVPYPGSGRPCGEPR